MTREFNITDIVRPSILKVKPYSSARDEFYGEALVFVDANENPNNNGYNRYPDPHQRDLKEAIGKLKNVDAPQLILGNGSDEIIDLIIRAFCEPGTDSILTTDPTYGMYSVAAAVNNVAVRQCTLTDKFELDQEALNKNIQSTKVVFLCSPNNPSGNHLDKRIILNLLGQFKGLVVVDEAYIDFSDDEGFVPHLHSYPNLFVLQTLSKAWGLASLRVGIGMGSPEVIAILNKIKPPYNISGLTQSVAIEKLKLALQKKEWVREILSEREKLRRNLAQLKCVSQVYPSDANFLLVRFSNAKQIYSDLLSKGIVTRDRSDVTLCANCLRITIGTKEENERLLNALTEV